MSTYSSQLGKNNNEINSEGENNSCTSTCSCSEYTKKLGDMLFTESFKQTNQQCAFSPDGNYLAHACACRLILHPFYSGENYLGQNDPTTFVCTDNINYIEWSPDSEHILCTVQKKNIIQVWSVLDPTWTCTLNHGSYGLALTRWTPDSRHILSTSDYKLRITVFSLINKSTSYIEYPKFSSKGIDFTKNGKYVAVAERRDHRDSICVLSSDTWQMLNRFQVDTNDLADLTFSPNGIMIATWDSKVEYKVIIYSIDGRLLFSYSANDIALLGVKTVSWGPDNHYLFIGSYDQQVRVINTLIRKPVCNLLHVSKITNPNVLVYEEVETTFDLDSNVGDFIVLEEPVHLSSIRIDPEKANPKLGVGTIICCHDGSYMASKNDNMPNVIWIWNTRKLELDTILKYSNTVKTFSWHPKQKQLAICTGNKKLYIWCPEGCLSVIVPSIPNLTNLNWHMSGTALLLIGKDKMCVSQHSFNEASEEEPDANGSLALSNSTPELNISTGDSNSD